MKESTKDKIGDVITWIVINIFIPTFFLIIAALVIYFLVKELISRGLF